MQAAHDIAGFAGQQPRLKRDKRDGMSSMDNRAWRRTCLRVQTRGNIERDNRRRMSVSMRDKLSDVFPGRAL